MAKPTLLTVDDDPNVLKAIERDLRTRYGEKYRVLRANSGDAGLGILRELKGRNDAVALLLAGSRAGTGPGRPRPAVPPCSAQACR